MSYYQAYTKIYRKILKNEGDFNMESVMVTAFLNCPESYTKKQIKELALQVLDDSLNKGMILMIGEGIYVSVLSKEAQRLNGVVKYGIAHEQQDDDSLSTKLKASIFNNQPNEEDILGK